MYTQRARRNLNTLHNESTKTTNLIRPTLGQTTRSLLNNPASKIINSVCRRVLS